MAYGVCISSIVTSVRFLDSAREFPAVKNRSGWEAASNLAECVAATRGEICGRVALFSFWSIGSREEMDVPMQYQQPLVDGEV
jgi:hypothetical protein